MARIRIVVIACVMACVVASGAVAIRVLGHRDAPQLAEMPGPVLGDDVAVHRFQYPTADSHDPGQNWADLYLPSESLHVQDRHIPLVILIHGGSWQSRVSASSFTAFARRLADRGLAVYNVEYRRVGDGGGWPTTFRDVAAALDYVPAVAKVYRQMDLRQATVVGHSAGAQLATWAATRTGRAPGIIDSTPKFFPSQVISLAGPLDLREAARRGDVRVVRVIGGTPQRVPERYRLVDPIENLNPNLPVIAVAGGRDTIVSPDLSERYVAAVRRVSGRARLVLLPKATHSSFVDARSPSFVDVLELVSRSAHDVHDDHATTTGRS